MPLSGAGQGGACRAHGAAGRGHPEPGQCILTVIPFASAGAVGTGGRAPVSHRRVMQITDECCIFVEYRVPSSSERSYRDLEDAAPGADGRLGPNKSSGCEALAQTPFPSPTSAVTGLSAESPGMTRRRGIPSGTGDFRRKNGSGADGDVVPLQPGKHGRLRCAVGSAVRERLADRNAGGRDRRGPRGRPSRTKTSCARSAYATPDKVSHPVRCPPCSAAEAQPNPSERSTGVLVPSTGWGGCGRADRW